MMIQNVCESYILYTLLLLRMKLAKTQFHIEIGGKR